MDYCGACGFLKADVDVGLIGEAGKLGSMHAFDAGRLRIVRLTIIPFVRGKSFNFVIC